MHNQLEHMDHTVQLVTKNRCQPIHSAILVTDTSVTSYPLTWLPERFYIVARLTAGSITVHLGAGRSVLSFRLGGAGGIMKIPIPNDQVSVETTGASGFYDIYPLTGYDGFEITS